MRVQRAQPGSTTIAAEAPSLLDEVIRATEASAAANEGPARHLRMLRREAADSVVAIVAQQLGIPIPQVFPGVSFADLGVDSLDVVEITLQIEDNLNIRFAEESLYRVKTVGDLIWLVDHCLAVQNE